MSIITKAQLINWNLQKQGLIDRIACNTYSQFGPFHSTNQTTPYLSLLARIESFIDKWSEFYHKSESSDSKIRTFIRLRCMRGTLHLIPHDESEVVKKVYSMVADDRLKTLSGKHFTDQSFTEVKSNIENTIKANSALPSAQLKNLLKAQFKTCPFKPKGKAKTVGCGIKYYLDCLGNRGALCYGVGTTASMAKKAAASKKAVKTTPIDWRKANRNWIISDHPLVEPPASKEEVLKADRELALWYFTLYGPASINDLVWWSGLSATRIKAACKTIDDKLTKLKVNGCKYQYYIMNEHLDEIKKVSNQLPTMCRLLPYEDAIIKAYKETRYRFFNFEDSSIMDEVIRRGEAMPSIWLDGEIVGSWYWKNKKNETMEVYLLKEISAKQNENLLKEIDLIKKFIEAPEVQISYFSKEEEEEELSDNEEESEGSSGNSDE